MPKSLNRAPSLNRYANTRPSTNQARPIDLDAGDHASVPSTPCHPSAHNAMSVESDKRFLLSGDLFFFSFSV